MYKTQIKVSMYDLTLFDRPYLEMYIGSHNGVAINNIFFSEYKVSNPTTTHVFLPGPLIENLEIFFSFNVTASSYRL